MTGEAHGHGVERLCEAGEAVYARALAEGRITREAAAEAPCLVDLGLLHPDPQGGGWLVPARPGEVIARLMREVRADVDAVHRRVSAVERLAVLGHEEGVASTEPGFRILEGKPRIRLAIDEATKACTAELLAVQPGGIRREDALERAIPLARSLEERNVRTRSLYTHVARHGQGLHSYLEKVGRMVEARTLDEVVERMMIFDRAVAYIPANVDRSLALEIRQPALVTYLAGVFEWLWRRALPMAEPVPEQAASDGITHREHAIAALLVEGLTDEGVARRLGLNVRTCRHHIARLRAALGCTNRTQLGAAIVRAGLDSPPE